MDLSSFTIHELRRRFSDKEIAELIGSLSEEEAKILMYDWNFWARPEQLQPPGTWFLWLILCGRGWGKTRTGSEWIIRRAKAGMGPIALIGETAGDVRDTMIEVGDSSIINVAPPDFKPEYEPSKRRLTFPNGVIATTFSGQDPDQLRGPQHQTVWMDEPAKWDYAQECVEQAMFGLRLGKDPRALATTTPRPIPIIKKWWNESQLNPERESDKPPRVYCTVGSTYDNSANLASQFIEQMQEEFEGTRLGEQELAGKILWESEHALWKQVEIDNFRVAPIEVPDMELRAIGVDPTVGDPNQGRTTTKRDIDECGIMVGGRGVDGHGYLEGDFTMRGSPKQWASRVSALLETGEYDFVVAEANQGGKLVTETLVAYGVPEAKIILVNASQGKLVRAEPVSLMAEQGKIHHVGEYLALENELVTYEGKGKSPNRLDAFVWLFTFLLLKKKRATSVKRNFWRRRR